MKNLSVSKKILVGFFVVIALIVVILGVTIVTSFSRDNDLERVENLSEMQMQANGLLDQFMQARVEMRNLFITVENDAEYQAAKKYMEAAAKYIDSIEAVSKDLDGYQAELPENLRAAFENVNNGIESIHANDLLIRSSTADFVAAGGTMATQSTALVDLFAEQATELAQTDPNGAMDRVMSALIPAQKLSEYIDSLRFTSRSVALSQDMDAIATTMDMLKTTLAEAEVLSANIKTEAGKAALQNVTDSAAVYQGHLLEVQTALVDSERIIADVRVVFDDVSNLINSNLSIISADVSTMIASTRSTSNVVMITMVAIVVFAIVFALVIAMVLARMITNPLSKMQAVMEQVNTTGNLKFSAEMKSDIEKAGQGKDEIATSLRGFSNFIASIVSVSDALEVVASRDLTATVEVKGPQDTMGNAINLMLKNLNEMFSEISSVANQVNISSGEIATGALRLAQGSTEQAATVEEIGASISEINEQMNTSSKTSQEAAEKGIQISTIAAEGSERMGQMMTAVQDINDATQNIGRVIKAIEDIAFQTNILALNAAVEAARAGAHGKGFAVVAEEVRNLAGKSADAAKETSALISENIEKAELGLSISKQTSETLTQIIDGIQQTSESLRVLAEQSQATKAATAQVNTAVDQVAQVVQQNSATSEESAAASQEMSGQAQILQQLLDMFQLRDSKRVGGGGGSQPARQSLPQPSDDFDSSSYNEDLGKY